MAQSLISCMACLICICNESKVFSIAVILSINLIPHINYQGKTVVFMADLLPSVGHIPLPYVMGYDTRPLITLDEKGRFLKEAADKEYVLFLEHDAVNECCTVQYTEKGVRLKDTFKFSELFG